MFKNPLGIFAKKTVTVQRLAFISLTSVLFQKYRYCLCQDFSDLFDLRSSLSAKSKEIKSKYSSHTTSFPDIRCNKKGDIITIQFPIDQRKCDVFALVVEAVALLNSSEFNTKVEITEINSFKHSTLNTIQINFKEKSVGRAKQGTLSIRGEFNLDKSSFVLSLEKQEEVTERDIAMLLKVFEEANKPSEMSEVRKNYISSLKDTKNVQISANSNIQSKKQEKNDILEDLKEKGIQVILPDYKEGFDHSWEEIGGYETQKKEIEDSILLSLTHSDLYDKITSATREKFEHNRPRAVLFEGPPGTGKTTSAKIIASTVGIPFVYIPIETILSKWYSESEKNLSEIFDNLSSLGKCIVFIDEIDALAVARGGSGVHEASKRLVSTLLRKIDSFESNNEVLLICATNRKDALDPALLSRLDQSITFDLPDEKARAEIFKRYAKHLEGYNIDVLSQLSGGLSGRGIYEVCKNAERKWASRYIKKEVNDIVPDLQTYEDIVRDRVKKALF